MRLRSRKRCLLLTQRLVGLSHSPQALSFFLLSLSGAPRAAEDTPLIDMLTIMPVLIFFPRVVGFLCFERGNAAFFMLSGSPYLRSLFFVSGVWILSFASRLFLEPHLVLRIGKFCDESILGFFVFFFVLFSGSFRDSRCLDFGLNASQEQYRG